MQKTSQYARDAYKARKPLSFILTKYGVLVIAALVAVLMLAPLYLVVINSFKSPANDWDSSWGSQLSTLL